MAKRDDWKRFSRHVTSSRRWKGVRLEAKRRDQWKCVQCGATGRLEVDHIKPVRTHEKLAFELSNLQTLCTSCHSRKTAIELGHGQNNSKLTAWRKLVATMQPK